MIPGVEVRRLEVKCDDRGWLAEVLRATSDSQACVMQQLYVTTGNRGKTKGKHYHTRKIEWFCVVRGKARLHLKDTRTGDQEVHEMGEHNMVTITIPPGVAHAITNCGNEPFYLIAAVNEAFDPADPDTFAFEFPDL